MKAQTNKVVLIMLIFIFVSLISAIFISISNSTLLQNNINLNQLNNLQASINTTSTNLAAIFQPCPFNQLTCFTQPFKQSDFFNVGTLLNYVFDIALFIWNILWLGILLISGIVFLLFVFIPSILSVGLGSFGYIFGIITGAITIILVFDAGYTILKLINGARGY